MGNHYEILGVKKTASTAEIKKAYRALATQFHPDHNEDDIVAEKRFKEIASAYAILSNPEKRDRYDTTGKADPVTISSRKGVYEIITRVCSGDLADIYKAQDTKNGYLVALKVVRDPRNNDLLENEAKVIKAVRPPDDKDEQYNRYFPRLHDSFKMNDGATHRQVNVLSWLEYWWTFDQVHSAFHGELLMNHGVWMFNRILGALGYIHGANGIIHGAVVPSNLLAYSSGKATDPWNHGVKLIDWSYAVKIGEKISVIVPEYKDFYPPEVLAKQPAIPATDIYMAAKCIIYVLGGDPKTNQLPPHIPGYLANFLKGCVIGNMASRPGHAWDLHQELKQHMREHYGKRKYVPFNMPIMG